MNHIPQGTSDRERFENGLLSIRFIGDDLHARGVSIYDLSTSLLALQRIVHKAYLAQENRLEKGAFPSTDEREKLALQLGERRRQSDAFALISILTNPVVQAQIGRVIDWVCAGFISYYTGKVIDHISETDDRRQQVFLSSIYSEMQKIAQRVDAAGGVQSISIGAPAAQIETVAAFTPETKEYLSSLQGQVALGDYAEIKGRVYKLYPASNIIAIRRSGGKTVSVFLSDSDFNQIRYHQESKPLFLFRGRPRYQFGVETKSVTEFVADSVVYLGDNENR